jgi:hypothetical protein
MYARMSRKTDALSALARAVELNPAGRAQLAQNERFAALRADPEFVRIVGGP